MKHEHSQIQAGGANINGSGPRRDSNERRALGPPEAFGALGADAGRLRKILETAGEAFISIDAGGSIVEWNPQAEATFGWSRDEAVGRPLAETIIPPRYRQAHFAGLERFLATGEGPVLKKRIELSALHRDGHEFPVEMTISAVRVPNASDDQNASDGAEGWSFNAFLHDITDRRHAEDRLRKSEVRLAEAQQVAHIGSWEWNVELDLISWSDELYRIFGLDPESFGASYAAFLECVHPDDRGDVDRTIQAALVDGEPFAFYHRIVRPDGSIRNLHAEGQVVTDADGRPIRLSGTGQDVTEQKQLEEESSRFWDMSLDLLAIVGFDGSLKRINAAHRQLLGYSEEELRAEPFIEKFHPADREGVLTEASRLTAGDAEVVDFQARVRCADGSYRALLWSGKSNPDQGLIYTVAKDVTERMRIVEEVQLCQELALAIGEATSIEAALDVTLRTICERTGWAFGQAWLREGSYLQCSAAWYAVRPGLDPFRDRSKSMTFERGRGLAGEAWATGKPVWMTDVRTNPRFTRTSFAREVGFRAGLAVPVPAGDEIVAVMEFFVFEARPEDEILTALVSGVAAQLGSVMKRKQAEEGLRESEECFRSLVESFDDYAIVMLDPSGHIESWNPGAERIIGYREEEILGYHVSRFYGPEAVETGDPERHLAVAAEHGTYEGCDWRVRRDGLRYWASVSITPLRGESGELRGFSYATRDVTELKRTEEELQRLGAIVESSEDAIIGATLENGIVTTWNRGAERLFGYSVREMTGRSLRALIPRDHVSLHDEILEHVREGRRVEQYETEFVCKNGALVDVALQVSPVRDVQGAIDGLSMIARDVTERRRAQRSMEHALGTYLDQDVADHILREGASLAGREVDVTMMFVDIRDFTSFATRFQPQEVVATLNCLFELAVPIISRHGGHVDKFVGDGLLAVFGAPQPQEDHACRALEAALEICRRAEDEFQGDLEIGIGIDSGPVVAGNVGGGGRLDFTVIGNAVNTASRVEAATRETGDMLLVTEATRARARHCGVTLEERPGIAMKGKREPVTLYAPRAIEER